jgi:Flp pilus assembly pilin Flp
MRVRRNALDRGATSVEYALLAGFIAVVVALAIAALGAAVLGLFGSGADAVQSPAPVAP